MSFLIIKKAIQRIFEVSPEKLDKMTLTVSFYLLITRELFNLSLCGFFILYHFHIQQFPTWTLSK